MIKSSDLNIIDLSKELVLLDNINLPFSSLLLKNGTQKVTSVLVNWIHENLNQDDGLTLEGADVTAFQSSSRTGDKNVCQILTKAVSVSGTTGAVMVEGISNLFAHELENRMLEIKRDLEKYLINGVYRESDSGPNARQMKGLLGFTVNDNKFTGNSVAIADLNDMSLAMRQAGTASNNLVLLCDYETYSEVADLYEDKTHYIGVTNEFGSPARKINTKYGSCFIYLADSMPEKTMAMVNMDFLNYGALRPLTYNDLAKTGDSRKGFIVLEGTLKVLNPNAVVTFKINTDNTAPTLSKVTLAEDKESVAMTFSEPIYNATANVQALKNSVKFAANGTNFSALDPADGVAIAGKDLIVTFDTALSGATNKIKVLANAIKDKAGNVITTDTTTDAIDAS